MAVIPIDQLRTMLSNVQARWEPKQTPLYQLTDAQRRTLLGVTVNEADRSALMLRASAMPPTATTATAPTAVDWRNRNGQNYVTPVKDQLNCGSCVSFACVAALESRVRIQHGQTLNLSEADSHFCSSHGANCGGWWPTDCISQLASRGVCNETSFPYSSANPGSSPRCVIAPDRAASVVKATGQATASSRAERKDMLASHGPMVAVFAVYEDFFGYSTGVYHHVSGGLAGYHAVLVVGYDDAQQAWICKNSWGTAWGDNGYFRIRYGDSEIENYPFWCIPGAVLPAQPVQWRGWEDLGGIITSGVGVSSWAANRLDCFARGTDNKMWHKWWNGSSWSNWEDLGGILLSAPSAVSWGANRIDTFHRGTNNRMYHKWWNGSTWSGWEDLGGNILSTPAVASWGANRLDTFARGTDNHLWHKWWNGSTWSNWEDLGGLICSAPTAVSWGPNRIDVFATGMNNHLWHKWWNGTAWSGWEDLGGVLEGGPTVASWSSGRLDVFCRGTDNSLWHKWYQNGWSGWEDLGGVIVDDPGAVSWGPNRIDVFAPGTNNRMYHKWWG